MTNNHLRNRFVRSVLLAVILLASTACRDKTSAPADAQAATPASASGTASASASPSESASSSSEEEEETTAEAGGGACPRPIHPDYCRHRCRTFAQRSAGKHAQRMRHSERVALGKCGGANVFAEDERPGDGGVVSGLVEYFDSNGELTGAVDTRATGCGRFGSIPTCTPRLSWEESRAVSMRLGTIVSPHLPPEVIGRIVRQDFGRFRICAQSTKVRGVGTVVAKTTIASDGSVASAVDDGSTASAELTACVLRAIRGLMFPQPSGGAIVVSIPIELTH